MRLMLHVLPGGHLAVRELGQLGRPAMLLLPLLPLHSLLLPRLVVTMHWAARRQLQLLLQGAVLLLQK